MDFEGDLRREILKILPHDKFDMGIAAELSTMPIPDLVIRFFNWRNRLIHPHPRKVIFSRELLANAIYPDHRTTLTALQSKIEKGEDIGPHLSMRIESGISSQSAPKKNLNTRRDLDLLLNEWGIHHLHLSTAMRPNGFVERTGVLLFAIFENELSYFLDVIDHGRWTDQHLVEVAVRNWPKANLYVSLKGVTAPERPVSAADRAKLRGAGVTSFVVIGSKSYISRKALGIASAGTSQTAGSEAQYLLRRLRDLENKLTVNPYLFRPQFEQAGMKIPSEPNYAVVLANYSYAVTFAIQERHSGLVIGLY